MKTPRLLVIGHARHGKDTVSDILCNKLNLTFTSSSEVANESIVYPVLKEKYDYTSPYQCFADRSNHREEWFDLIKAFNDPDLTALSRTIFKENNIYCGLRNREELLAGKEAGLFDAIIWVDRSRKLKSEGSSSCSVTVEDADYIINNNYSLRTLYIETQMCINELKKRRIINGN